MKWIVALVEVCLILAFVVSVGFVRYRINEVGGPDVVASRVVTVVFHLQEAEHVVK